MATHISEKIFEKYENNFLCYDMKKKNWYEYENHRWIQCDENKFIEKVINNIDIVEYPKIKYKAYKDRVLYECKYSFYKKVFFNSDPYLIGFRNGVYDMMNKVFRNGLSNDYISLQMGVDYVEYDKDHQDVKDVYNLLIKIFPNKGDREEFFKFCKKILHQTCNCRCMYILEGETVLKDIFIKIFGQYCQELDYGLLKTIVRECQGIFTDYQTASWGYTKVFISNNVYVTSNLLKDVDISILKPVIFYLDDRENYKNIRININAFTWVILNCSIKHFLLDT